MFLKDTEVSCPVRTRREEFENRAFTLKMHQMFSIRTTLEQFRHVIIPDHFGNVFEQNLVREITVIIFEKFRFQNMFRPHERPAFSISSGLKSVIE